MLRTSPLLPKYTNLLSAILSLAGLVWLIYPVAAALALPEDIRGFEPNVVYTIQQILEDNGRLFANPVTPPFSITQYTPLFYITADALLSLLTIKAHQYEQIWVISRWLSLLAALGGMAILLITVKHYWPKSTGWQPGAGSYMAWLLATLALTLPWYLLARPDGFLLLFTAATAWFLLRYVQSQRWQSLAATAVFTVLALASKQSAVACGIACMLVLLLQPKPLKAAGIYVACGILSTAILAAILWIAGYATPYILDNVYTGVKNGINWPEALAQWKEFVVKHAGVLGCQLILLPVAFGVLKQRKQHKVPAALLLYAWVHLLVAHVLVLKAGSTVGYFNEATLLLLTALVLLVPQLPLAGLKLAKPALPLALLAVAGWACWFNAKPYLRQFAARPQFHNQQMVARTALANTLRANASRYFYSQDKYLNLMLPAQAVLPHQDITEVTFPSHYLPDTSLHKWLQGGQPYYFIQFKKQPVTLFQLTEMDYQPIGPWMNQHHLLTRNRSRLPD